MCPMPQIREELLSVINRGARALIVDMTLAVSCITRVLRR